MGQMHRDIADVSQPLPRHRNHKNDRECWVNTEVADICVEVHFGIRFFRGNSYMMTPQKIVN